ncbi:MAG: CapA family protein [Coriobacteriia bacterium]|nr:CapA family protein [Coriobacteriia bacterium]
MDRRRRSSRVPAASHRNLYVRADLHPVYGSKRRHSVPIVPILVIVLVMAIAGGGAYVLFGRSGGGKSPVTKNSTESSATAALKDLAAPGTPTAAAKKPASHPTARPTVSVAAVGDICFMDSNHNSLGSAESLLASMKTQLSAADLTVGNLEVALTNGGSSQDKTYTFRAPLSNAGGMAAAGIDVVSVANNHALDYGRSQLPAELDALHQAGLTVAGGGLNKKQAWSPQTVNRNGARIGVLAFSEITPAEFAATETQPGVAYTQDSTAITAAVAAAKASKKYDYLIVVMHWGVEGDYQDNKRQINEAHALIDAGADAIIGSHPHRLQGVEYYKNGLIAYSLGNFVFGTSALESRQTMLLNFQLTDKGVQAVTALPTYIMKSGKPVPADGSDWDKIAEIIKSSSTYAGTQVTFKDNLAVFEKK